MPTDHEDRPQVLYDGRNRDDAGQARGASGRSFGNRGQVTSRPSRESIVSSYAAQDAARARSARMRSQEAAKSYNENSLRLKERENQRRILEARRAEEERLQAQRRQAKRDMEAANARTTSGIHEQEAHGIHRAHRVVKPLSTQESRTRAQISRDGYEREREMRDALSVQRSARTTNREVIDGRGSIDSRAFNEMHRLSGYSVDESDKPDPMIDTSNPKAKWRSHAGEGGASHVRLNRRMDLGSLSDTISGSANYGRASAFSSLPPFVKIAVPVLVILVIILVAIVFF